MSGNKVQSDADLQNCIYFQQRVEVWMGGDIVEIVMITNYDDIVIEIVGGDMFLRQNVNLKIA